jgi:hypothetical protein
MKPANKISGVALAATAATLFAVAPMNVTASSHSTGKCMGGNSCKGQSYCHTSTTGCGGQNSCKGQGWIKATKAECDEKGGQFED